MKNSWLKVGSLWAATSERAALAGIRLSGAIDSPIALTIPPGYGLVVKKRPNADEKEPGYDLWLTGPRDEKPAAAPLSQSADDDIPF